jgi:hypothetical protein
MNMQFFVKYFIWFLFLFVSIACNRKENKVKNIKTNFILDKKKLSLESSENEHFLVKYYTLNYSPNQIIYRSEIYDLDGDGVNEKIKVVVLDENYFKEKNIKGQYLAKLIINEIDYDLVFNRSIDSFYKDSIQVIDVDKRDKLKELLITQFEPGTEEDPSQIHSVFRYFGNKLLTETFIKSEGYGGGGLNFVENKLEVTHKNDPKTIGTYVLSNYFLDNTNMFVGEESGIPAACPYVYLKSGNEFLYKGEIIRNLIGKNSETLQRLDLGYSKNEKIIIRIKEEKKEVSYLNFIAIEINGKVIFPSKNSKNTNLISDDNKYIKLKQGEYIDLEFTVKCNSKIKLIGKGYYVPLP